MGVPVEQSLPNFLKLYQYQMVCSVENGEGGNLYKKRPSEPSQNVYIYGNKLREWERGGGAIFFPLSNIFEIISKPFFLEETTRMSRKQERRTG